MLTTSRIAACVLWHACNVVQCRAMACVLCRATTCVLCRATSCYVVLRRAMSCYYMRAMPCYVVLCRASASQDSSAELGPINPASRLAARLAIPLVGPQNLQDFSTTLGTRKPASCLATRLAIPRIGLQNLQDFSATLGPGILQILPAARSLSSLHLLGSRLQSTHKRQGCWKTLHAFFLLDKSGYRWIQMQREP